MTGEHSRIPATAGINESERRASDAGTRRFAAFLMVLFAMLLAVLTWFSNEVNTTHASGRNNQAAETQTSREAEQSPPARVKQGTEPEEHIQAF